MQYENEASLCVNLIMKLSSINVALIRFIVYHICINNFKYKSSAEQIIYH